jgi:hypothetical protein
MLSWLALIFLAKSFWFKLRSYEPATLYFLIELSCLLLAIDFWAWGTSSATRIGIGIVLAIRYAAWAFQIFVYQS